MNDSRVAKLPKIKSKSGFLDMGNSPDVTCVLIFRLPTLILNRWGSVSRNWPAGCRSSPSSGNSVGAVNGPQEQCYPQSPPKSHELGGSRPMQEEVGKTIGPNSSEPSPDLSRELVDFHGISLRYHRLVTWVIFLLHGFYCHLTSHVPSFFLATPFVMV